MACLAAVLVVLLGLVGEGQAVDYHVGPGQVYSSIEAVGAALLSLGGGDVLYLHYRSSPYSEKLVLCGSGATSANPRRVSGVLGPQGQRPILEGSGASTFTGFNYLE